MEDDVNSAPLNPYENVPVVPPQRKLPIPKIIIILIVVALLLISSVLFFILQKQSLKKPVDNILITPSVTSKQVIPSTSAVINEIVILKKGINTPVPKTDITLIYRSGNKTDKNCADCLATTSINMKQNQEVKVLDYSCGGIAGGCINSLEGFGYKVELLKDIDENTIEVLVTK